MSGGICGLWVMPNAQVDRTHSRRRTGGDRVIGMTGGSEGEWQLWGPGSNAWLGGGAYAELPGFLV
jgi:hypothetical protein